MENCKRIVRVVQNTLAYRWFVGVHGGAVGWGTALQAGRSRVRLPMVSLEIFIDIILPAALVALGSTQPLTEMSTRYFLGVKAAGAYGRQPYHLHVTAVLKFGSFKLLEPCGSVQACTRISVPYRWFVHLNQRHDSYFGHCTSKCHRGHLDLRLSQTSYNIYV